MSIKRRSSVLIAGLALFSMFFGAGDLIWPLILGGSSGDQNFMAMLGLLITGVSLPLLGLMAMMLFKGDYRTFFKQIGPLPGIILLFIIQAILGPFGSLPRLITLSHATLKAYLPEFVTLPIFSLLASLLIYVLTLKRHRVVDLVGLILCPLLLLFLAGILILGLTHPPQPDSFHLSSGEAFFGGLKVGYNTLDLIASFIFAPLILSYFQHEEGESQLIFRKMVKSCLIAGFLLAGTFVGLTYMASYYTPILPGHAPEERLATISMHLLGSGGALCACIIVALSCLTTAIPISVVSANYIHQDLLKGKGNLSVGAGISLGLTTLVANMGFMGIASMLSPLLQILCPGLIILSVFCILHKLYEMRIRKSPIFIAFALATIGYFIH